MDRIFPFPGQSMYLPDIVRAENCSLFDREGRRWVDLESGVWCTGIGHANKAVNQALAAQMQDLTHVGFCYSSPVLEHAAERVQRTIRHEGGRCVFLCSGSEAVEYGIRVIRAVSDRPRILTMADSYFGAYGDAAARQEAGWHLFDWFGCGHCEEQDCPDTCPRWQEIPFAEIGALLLEPGSSSGFVRFPPQGLVRSLARQVREAGGMVMVNEVTTGMGRTGEWFGYSHYGLEPDIVVLGKGVGNGYPVSVTSLGPDVVDRLGGTPIAYGQSHYNDPLGAAAARTVFDYIDEHSLLERARHLSQMLFTGLGEIQDRGTCIKALRGRGLMIALELDPDQVNGRKLHASLIESGYVTGLRPGNQVLRLDPALTIEEQDLTDFLLCLQGLLPG